jgi:hypothetical protein
MRCAQFDGGDVTTANLFADIPAELPDESVQTLAACPGVRVERLVTDHGSGTRPRPPRRGGT